MCRITCILLLFESVYFSKQFIHYLCHIAHNSNGTTILHTRRANYTQQTANFTFMTDEERQRLADYMRKADPNYLKVLEELEKK